MKAAAQALAFFAFDAFLLMIGVGILHSDVPVVPALSFADAIVLLALLRLLYVTATGRGR